MSQPSEMYTGPSMYEPERTRAPFSTTTSPLSVAPCSTVPSIRRLIRAMRISLAFSRSHGRPTSIHPSCQTARSYTSASGPGSSRCR